MAKTASEKTNGHTIAELKTAASATRAAKAGPKKTTGAAAKKAVPAKAALKPAVRKSAAASAPKEPVKAIAPVRAKAAPKAVAKAAPKAVAKAAPAAAPKIAMKAPAAAPAKALAKPVAKSGSGKAAKPAPKLAAPATPDSDADSGTRDKARKAKLVRDSFTMPEQEYAVLGQVKKACLKAGFEIKKSELLRIGVALISDLDIATLQKVLSSLPQLKTGRPKSE
ncbi:hypothetical protein PO883_19985 [Massilia sp. DJPM01]|uniref:hypothetical protein n=1 Tax=Massilia sp. DJPM01 TaxID=3024404 RepID=UPI00259F5FA1|nr:hypothetical protein [Massilia sp. DJPM01]MDM5179476.1 hypothetical protein [Massilia sp. DJPM01]